MGKLKLKKKAKILLTVITLFLVLSIIGINSLIKYKKQKEYEKTYEYKLTNIGYDLEDAKKIDKIYKDKEKDYILEQDKNSIYLALAKEKYFIYDNFYRYLDYLDNNENLTSLVEIVNTNRDKEYYSLELKTDTSKNNLIIVNKYYSLEETFEPENLVNIPTTYAYGEYGSKKVTKETYDAYMNMWNASHEAGYYLMVSSAYRTYKHQVEVYEDYKKRKGEEYADSIAARPGYSEHQTGLSLDIFERGYTQSTFENSESYNWLKENAYKYGFIERYPKDKENITGYKYESWHYRYVGIEAASYIHEHNITFDEYYAYFVK